MKWQRETLNASKIKQRSLPEKLVLYFVLKYYAYAGWPRYGLLGMDHPDIA